MSGQGVREPPCAGGLGRAEGGAWLLPGVLAGPPPPGPGPPPEPWPTPPPEPWPTPTPEPWPQPPRGLAARRRELRARYGGVPARGEGERRASRRPLRKRARRRRCRDMH